MTEGPLDDRSLLARAVVEHLEQLRRAGLTHLPRGDAAALAQLFEDEAAAPEPEPVPTPVAHQPAQPQPVRKPDLIPDPEPKAEPPVRSTPRLFGEDEPEDEYVPPEDRPRVLAFLAERVAECTKCEELAETRRQTVFGVGNPQPRLVFFGEAPGADEDRQGEPFVGEAGQLLDRMIQAMGLSRSDVYILNTIKCRPPRNRTPADAELANCRHFYRRQLAILRPEVICCLGAVAAKELLGTRQGITSLRGKWKTFGEAQVMCTYHPAYLLRKPEAKRLVWEDLQEVMRILGLARPGSN
jgi:DNA polymerase